MPKLTAHFAEKSPTGQFANQQVGVSIEAELDADSQDAIQAGLRRLFHLARQAVAEQLGQSAQSAPQPRQAVAEPRASAAPASYSPPAPPNGRTQVQRPGNGNGHRVPATPAQRKAVYAICKSQGLDPKQYDTERMSVREASELIDRLKSQQVG